VAAIPKPCITITGEKALEALLPFKPRRCHQILAIEVKQIEQEEHKADTAVARVAN
jgi:hypothetical protein